MKTRTLSLVVRIGLMAPGALCSGCSILGLAVDASRQPDTLAVEPGEKLLGGKNVLLTLRDGYGVAGECRRLGHLPGELYRSRYAAWQGTPGREAFSLSPGDTVHVTNNNGQISAGSLEGFTRTAIVIHPFLTAPAALRRRPQVLSIPMEKIDSLWTTDGTSLDGRKLRAWIEEKHVPTTDAMLVHRAETSVWVPLDEIAQIREIRYSYEWFHTGALADAAALAATVVFLAVRGP